MAVITKTPILALRRIDWRSPWTMFWAGFIARVLYITVAHSYHYKSNEDHFEFGWEMGRIARAVVLGRGYADPFVNGTGPTAWSPPLYPLLLAAVFKVFGIYTPISGWVILSINSLFSALTAPAIYEIATRCYGTSARGLRIALWSGWLWALYPAAMQYAVRWVWEMSLTAMLFTWALVFALRIRDANGTAIKQRPNSVASWLFLGLLWGMIALANPALLLFFPICILWLITGDKDKAAAIRNAILACVVFTACLAPWVGRNWAAFHSLIVTRGNLGAELYAGNGPGSYGFPWGATISMVDGHFDTRLYKQLGELRYVKMQGDKAKAYIRSHKIHFAQISLKRFYFFWAGVLHPTDRHPVLEYIREINYCFFSLTGLLGLGLSLRRRIPGLWLFTWAFLLLPVSYYFVTPGARFRHPLEPLIDIFTAFLFQSVTSRKPASRIPRLRNSVS
jgi:hypothetical protein